MAKYKRASGAKLPKRQTLQWGEFKPVERNRKPDCVLGRKRRIFRVTKLITQLLSGNEERQQLGKLDPLIQDEQGYALPSRAGAKLLFDITTMYERSNLIVPTNLPFEGWTTGHDILGNDLSPPEGASELSMGRCFLNSSDQTNGDAEKSACIGWDRRFSYAWYWRSDGCSASLGSCRAASSGSTMRKWRLATFPLVRRILQVLPLAQNIGAHLWRSETRTDTSLPTAEKPWKGRLCCRKDAIMPFRRPFPIALVLLLMSSLPGCGSIKNYFHNGFKVGPNYTPPCASVAEDWIDDDPRIRRFSDDLNGWWTVFDDPQLNGLIQASYQQNLTLREAGFRILSARAQYGYAKGNFFPQLQTAQGGYSRLNVADNFFDQWDFGFNLAWELDFWGRYRRAIAAAEATLDASVHNYDYVLVTLLGDVATSYVDIRTTQERIRLAENTLRIQEDVLKFIEERLKAGAAGVTELDRAQAESNWKQSEAQIHDLKIMLRTAENQLCILLGMPPEDLTPWMASGPQQSIPKAPSFVAVGIPAELLSRRPDLRELERLVAAQAEQIGIAETDWFPAISINGTLGWQATSLSNLFTPQAQTASIGPSFQWKILNYGRILNNVRYQEAEYQRLITVYQNTALQAAAEAENGIVKFTQGAERAQALEESVDAAYRALGVVVAQYEAGLGGVDFNRYATILQSLVQQQDTWAQARGQNAQGMIDIYRALGGGWQIRLAPVPEKQGILSDTLPVPDMPPAPDQPQEEQPKVE